jgi:hypothetical protein
MEELIPKPAEADRVIDEAIELGEILGRRKAFATVAGKCSAADAECIRRLRDDQLFKLRAASWEEFCPKYLGISKAQANRVIQRLERFGPDYFTLAQLIHITPEQYAAIASSVGESAVHCGGEVIALVPENTTKLAAAVEALCQAAPAAAAKTDANLGNERLRALERRIDAVVKEFEKLHSTGEERLLLSLMAQRAVFRMQSVEILTRR